MERAAILGTRHGLSDEEVPSTRPLTSHVLVTGAGGFIGSHLVEDQLRRGLGVRAVDLHLEALAGVRGERLERATADITDRAAMDAAVAGADVVYHLASRHLEVGVPDAEYRRVNVEGTRLVLERSARAGVRRFVYCSTTGLMGSITHPPADEDAPPNPDIIYERTKWEAEQLVSMFGRESDMETVIVRPAWVYGPRCPRTERLFRAARKGCFLMIGDGRCLRHPVYIDDMCAGFHLSATVSAARGRTYIIGGAEAVPVHDLVEAVARTVGTRVRLVKLAPGIALPLFRAVETAFLALGKKPPVSPRSMKFFTQQTCYDISRARRELGYEPAVSLEEGLRRTWDAMNVRNLRKSQPATGA